MEEFLIALMGMAQGYLTIWDKATKKTCFFSLTNTSWLKEATSYINQLVEKNLDVYFGVCARREKLDETKRGGVSDVLSLPAVWADVDINGSGHTGTNYPETIEIALKLIKDSGLPYPSVTISTGGGLHLYWLLDSPFLTDSSESLKEAQELTGGWQKYLQQYFKSHNYKLDSTGDLPRVLRVPNTFNFKDQANPKKVEVLEELSSWERFTVSELKGVLTSRAETIDLSPLIGPAFNDNSSAFIKGSAHIAYENCAFLQYCEKQATTLSEPEWHAMITNLVLTKGGAEFIHQISSAYPNYTTEETEEKIKNALVEPKPHTCEYIRNTLGYAGCPKNGCPFKSPIGWATSQIGAALEYVQDFIEDSNSKSEDLYSSSLLQHLAILKLLLLAKFEQFMILLDKRFRKTGFSKRSLQKAVDSATSLLKEQQQQFAKHIEAAELEQFAAILGFVPKLPDGYRYHDGHIGKQTRDTFSSLGQRLVFVSAFFDGNTQFVELTYNYRNDEWRKCVVSRSEISALGDITRLSDHGLPFNASNAQYWIKFLNNFMDCNHDCIPIRKSSNHYGWQDDGGFLPGDSDFLMIPNGTKTPCNFEKWSKGTIDDWRSIMQPVLSEPFARLLLAASFAAPLLKKIGIRTFIVHIYGPSQGGKTAALKAAASVWRNPDKLMFNFNATKVAFERKISELKHLPVVIDERQAAGTNQAFLDGVVYLLGEGHGKERGNRDNGLQAVGSWCTVVITSGEDPLSSEKSRQGVKTRALEIYAEKVFSDTKVASTMYQLPQKAFGVAGSRYIQWITAYPQRVIDIFQHFKELLQQTSPKLSSSDYDYLAVLATADLIMAEACFNIPMEEDLSKVALPLFISLVIEQRKSVLLQNDFQRSLDFIKSEVQNTRGKYADIRTIDGTRRINNPTHNTTITEDGWILDEKDLFINPNILQTMATKGEFNLVRFKEDAARSGLLKTTIDRGSISYTTTTTKESGGTNVRMFCFPNFFTQEKVRNITIETETHTLEFTGNELRYNERKDDTNGTRIN